MRYCSKEAGANRLQFYKGGDCGKKYLAQGKITSSGNQTPHEITTISELQVSCFPVTSLIHPKLN